jgi:hypothetical protein
MGTFFVQTPGANLDYKFDWSDWLESGETIASAIVSTTSSITLSDQSNDDSSVTIWVSGGLLNNSHIVTCQITTSLGRITARSINIYVQDIL